MNHPTNKPDNPFPKRKHLRRLEVIFDQWNAPLYEINICVKWRRKCLANPQVFRILVASWKEAGPLYDWQVGRYMVMPDHVHFFVTTASREHKDLSDFIGGWKSWTRKEVRRLYRSFDWQKELFDHLVRSGESYGDRWNYLLLNPVKAGLVKQPEDWPYQGEITPIQWF